MNFWKKFQTAFDPPLILENYNAKFFIMDIVAFKRGGKGPGQEQDGNSQCEGGEPDWDYKELELELTGDLIVEIVTKCGRFSTTHVTTLDTTARPSACDLDHIQVILCIGI